MFAAKLQNNRARRTIIIFAAIMAIGLTASITTGHTSGDFDIYYAASHNYLAHAPVYIGRGGTEEFKYSPLFALLFLPFTLLPRIPALYLWGIFNIFLLYFMFYFFYRLKLVSFSSARDFFLIFCLFALTGRYIFSNIKVGQVNILLCFLLVLTMYFEIKKRDFWAAACLSFSLMIKFFPLLMLAYFILRRRFRIVGFTFLMTSAFLLLPAVYSGFGQNLQYIKDWLGLLKTTPAPIFYSVKNYSLFSFFSWAFVASRENFFIFNYRFLQKGLTPAVYYGWAVTCFIMFASFFYDSISKKDKDLRVVYLDYAGLFVCMLLFNPLAYLNALVFLIVPFFFILRLLFYRELNKGWALVSGALTVICFIILMTYNKCFFPDRYKFYSFLEYRTPMWGMILVYLNLWLLKAGLKSKIRKAARA